MLNVLTPPTFNRYLYDSIYVHSETWNKNMITRIALHEGVYSLTAFNGSLKTTRIIVLWHT